MRSPTPAMFMSTITPGFECDGAIMLTAGRICHLIATGWSFLPPKVGLQKQDITDVFKRWPKAMTLNQPHRPVTLQSMILSLFMLTQFVKNMRESVNHPDNFEEALTGLKVVVDAGNGAGGFYVDKVLKPLGADTTGSQYKVPDGTFPDHVPNPEDLRTGDPDQFVKQ